MKKIFILILFVLMLFVCSCRGQNDIPLDTKDDPETTLAVEEDSESELESESETLPETEPVPETAPPTDDPEEDDDYKDIALRETSLYESRLFAVDGSQYYFSFSMPKEWTVLSDGKSGYNIVLDGTEIGKVYSSAKDGFEEWKTVDISESVSENISIVSYIEKRGIGDTLEFRRRYCYSYNEGNAEKEIMITVKYEELSERGERRMLNPTFASIRTDARMGILSDIADGSILIVGNSFINTSNIGEILTEMMQKNGKKCKITAISRGYATVETYVNDSSLMSDIRSGKYDAVFVCGFYSTSEITNLGKLKTACDSSNTKLVIFPAHNENSSAISGACRKYNELEFLDWKGEIDSLIASGVNKSYMCINDSHLHSTTTAGYVGAHMIYRAIYGEIPKQNLSLSIVQSAVNRMLDDYVTTGNISRIDMTALNYIK